MYDYAIVGAGINGSFMAHLLSQEGKSVAIFDPKGIAGSGSGAAGAFLSPKVGKGGPLQQFVNQAYEYSINYYEKHFSHLLTQKGLLQIPKDRPEADDDFLLFKKIASSLSSDIPASILDPMCEQTLGAKGIYYKSGAIIEPGELCKELIRNADLFIQEVSELVFEDNAWHLNKKIKAKHLILATGAYDFIIKEDYFKLRPVWGERIEIISDTKLSCNYHQKISVSATKANGHIVIGATHEQHSYDKPLQDSAANTLLKQAQALIDLKNVKLVDHRGGVRSGSFDYFPLVGPLVDANATLEKHPDLIKGAKLSSDLFTYHENLSVINGVGGRGFILAPYLATQLCSFLLKKQELNPAILPSRLFVRWAKKEPSLKKHKDSV